MRRMSCMLRGAPLLLGALALAGCESGMHEMYEQPRYDVHEPSSLWTDGDSARPQVHGTLPRSAGADAGSSSGRKGRVRSAPPPGPVSGVDAHGRPLAQGGPAAAPGYANPLPITPQLLARGRERFNIYCAPCHSRSGDGDGMIVRRGFPRPPSYHSARLRHAPDSHFYKVISDGYGVMYSYADRVSPHDRWAIVAYIRALQLSQRAPASMLTKQDIEQLSHSSGSNPSPPGKGAGARVRSATKLRARHEPSSVAARHLLPRREGKRQGAVR